MNVVQLDPRRDYQDDELRRFDPGRYDQYDLTRLEMEASPRVLRYAKRGSEWKLIAHREEGGICVAHRRLMERAHGPDRGTAEARKTAAKITEQCLAFAEQHLDLNKRSYYLVIKLWLNWPTISDRLAARAAVWRKQKRRFVIPDLEEVVALCQDRSRRGDGRPDPPRPVTNRKLPSDVSVLQAELKKANQQNRLEREEKIKLRTELDEAKAALRAVQAANAATNPPWRHYQRGAGQDCGTPDVLFWPLDNAFHFVAQAFTSKDQAGDGIYSDRTADSLSHPWPRGSIFVYAPANLLAQAARRSYQHAARGLGAVVAVLPFRLWCGWFRQYVWDATIILVPPGEGVGTPGKALSEVCIAIFWPGGSRRSGHRLDIRPIAHLSELPEVLADAKRDHAAPAGN